MKTILIGLLLVSTSVLAQGYGYYPQQQYNYDYYDNQERMDQQRQLQQEFLDQQFINQLVIEDFRQFEYEKRKREWEKEHN